MTARTASELLYDSEAALRLVDSAIEEIRDSNGAPDATSSRPDLPARDVLARLERSLALVDSMDAAAAAGDTHGGATLRATLRAELFSLMGCSGLPLRTPKRDRP